MTLSKDPKEQEHLALREAALKYHPPGKISVTPIMHLSNQRDLALAYSPGVELPDEIVNDAANVFKCTARGNLVGVVTMGIAAYE